MRFPTIVGERDPIMRAGIRAAGGVVIGALVGLTAAGLLYLSRPVQYSSAVAVEVNSAALMVDLNPTGARIDDVTIDTDAVLTAADPVVAAVAAAVGRDESVVRKALTVRARPLARILEITYTTPTSADSAREGVTVAAEAYLDLRERLIIEPVREYIGGVITSTDRVQQDDLSTAEVLSGGQAAMEKRLERAEAYQTRLPAPGVVLASASVPAARRGTIDVTLMSGALLGALLGFGVGLSWESRRQQQRRESPDSTRMSPAAGELSGW